jgi:hypothetical protein
MSTVLRYKIYVSERNQFAVEKALACGGRVLEVPDLRNYA